MKKSRHIIPAICIAAILAGCSQQASVPEDTEQVYVNQVAIEEVEIENEAVALAALPALSNLLMPEASGKSVEKNDKAQIDYSNVTDGYIMVQFTAATDKRLKVRVTGPSTQYTYNLNAGEWTTFPLSDGNGGYTVTVYENTTDDKYATVLTASFDVSLKDEFAPFLRPNQYVNYENAPDTIAKGAELAGGISEPLDKVAAVYDYVIHNLTYDKSRAANVKSGYLPVLDSVLAEKKGICFDYAALMTAMLRSQNIPCKLVVGYAGTAYHAWISVWTEETGWVDGVIYFDGTEWQRMDPTFASSANGDEAIMKYIGNGDNYKTKYLY